VPAEVKPTESDRSKTTLTNVELGQTKTETSPAALPAATVISTDTLPTARPTAALKDLFPSVVITIPPPALGKDLNDANAQNSPSPSATEEPGISPSPSPGEAQAKTSTPQTPDAGSLEGNSASPSPTSSSPVEKKEGSPTPTVSPSPEVSVTPDTATTAPTASPSPAGDAASRGASTVFPPCTLTTSDETVNLKSSGGDLAVIVGRSDDSEDLDDLTALSTSPQDVSVRREIIAGVTSRAIFVLRSVSAKPGIYQVRFELPCGRKEIVVNVR
jgi:hypothetical protein